MQNSHPHCDNFVRLLGRTSARHNLQTAVDSNDARDELILGEVVDVVAIAFAASLVPDGSKLVPLR